MSYFAVICLLGFTSCCVAVQDLTEVRYARGADVVDAVIVRLDTAFELPNNTFWMEGRDSLFLRDVAFVESNFGTDPNTFTSEYLGGIWQVVQSAFDSTKDPSALKNQGYANKLTQISTILGIDWLSVEWEELTKPLYSALAARLVLHLKPVESSGLELCGIIPSTDEKELYSAYWYQCYRNSLRGNVTDFDRIVLPSREDCSVATDVMFVLDSSGSINIAHPDNWDRVKLFTSNFIAGLLGTGTNDNRVGIVTFSTTAVVNFNLTGDRDTLLQGIATLPYIGRYTNTADGLCQLTDQVWREGTLRLVIVMTDGGSNRNSTDCGTTIDAPSIVNSAICPPPLYYVLGVSRYVRDEELQAIATGPEYIDYLDGFQNAEGFAALRRRRTYQICYRASSFVCGETISKSNFGRNDRALYQLNVEEEGLTIRLCVTEGQVVLYASTLLSNPSRASNSFSFGRGVTQGILCEDVFVTPEMLSRRQEANRKRQVPSSVTNLYVTIEGIDVSSSFTLETPTGNSSQNPVSCRNDACGENTTCIDEPIGYTCTCLDGFEFGDNLKDCIEVNECLRQPLPCHQSAYCINTVGSYDCTCHPDYLGDGRECTLDDNSTLKLTVTIVCSVGGALLLVTVVFVAVVKVIFVMTNNQNGKASTSNT